MHELVILLHLFTHSHGLGIHRKGEGGTRGFNPGLSLLSVEACVCESVCASGCAGELMLNLRNRVQKGRCWKEA